MSHGLDHARQAHVADADANVVPMRFHVFPSDVLRLARLKELSDHRTDRLLRNLPAVDVAQRSMRQWLGAKESQGVEIAQAVLRWSPGALARAISLEPRLVALLISE